MISVDMLECGVVYLNSQWSKCAPCMSERIAGSNLSELDGEMGHGWERDVSVRLCWVSVCTPVDLHYFWQQNVTYAAR